MTEMLISEVLLDSSVDFTSFCIPLKAWSFLILIRGQTVIAKYLNDTNKTEPFGARKTIALLTNSKCSTATNILQLRKLREETI